MSFGLPAEANDTKPATTSGRELCEALNLCLQSEAPCLCGDRGPVFVYGSGMLPTVVPG